VCSSDLDADVDGVARSGVATRLRRMLGTWTAAAGPEPGVADRLSEASPDEVLDFIDQELGRLSR
jgi:hypothetical protein